MNSETRWIGRLWLQCGVGVRINFGIQRVLRNIYIIPSSVGKETSSTQMCLGGGYVSSLFFRLSLLFLTLWPCHESQGFSRMRGICWDSSKTYHHNCIKYDSQYLLSLYFLWWIITYYLALGILHICSLISTWDHLGSMNTLPISMFFLGIRSALIRCFVYMSLLGGYGRTSPCS